MKMVRETLHNEHIDVYDFEGRVVDIIGKLQHLQERNEKEVYISWEYDYDDVHSPKVCFYREENIYEKEARLKEAEKMEHYRREQYIKLKKEFEGDA